MKKRARSLVKSARKCYNILNHFIRKDSFMFKSLQEFLTNSLTPYHTVQNVKKLLLEQGFRPLLETADWTIEEGGSYFVVRGGSIIAFTVDSTDTFSFKIVASHSDSPAFKVKENPERKGAYVTLNTEKYGGGLFYSFLDRPLKIAGRIVKQEGELLREETVESPFLVCIPSLAIHMNRSANEGFALNAQVDMQPLFSLNGEDNLLEKMQAENAVAYDLYVVSAENPYTFGANDEFFASPRIDNLTSAFSSVQALCSKNSQSGISVAAILNNEETGSLSTQGADGDFLENTLRRIAYTLRFDENEYYRALASSFMISLDNAHALHPNHPEKSDPTNKTLLGGGVVIKSHADNAYITDAVSSAVVKTVFRNAGAKYQYFFNRSDARSGGTLGALSLRHVSIAGADMGLAQLAMHSACECFAKADYQDLMKGLTEFYSSEIFRVDEGFIVRK